MTGKEGGSEREPPSGSDGAARDDGTLGGSYRPRTVRGDGSGEGPDGSVVRRDRFSGGPARDFLSSLSADRRIFAADLAVDRAHVVMLAERGIVDEAVVGEILAALEEIEAAGHGALPDGEDVHEAIETAVIERVGPEGGRMHTARSRNDEVATCIRYRLREDLLGAIDALLDVRGAILEEARAHADVVMPGYTHLQPAQPTTVGHWLASYESALSRDTERLLAAYDRTNRSPLGAAAFAGTTFDVDRGRVAELLGFEEVVENAIDAVSTRDFLLETVGALAALAVTLSGLAEDVVVFANRGYVDLHDDYASTSSIMPQKKNPDTLELVRAVAGDAAGAFGGLATTLEGLPRAYNRDLQRAGPHAWEAIDAVTDAIDVAGGAVATASWDGTALEAAAGEGFSTATGVADLLARSGVPFRTAHEVVALAAEEVTDDPGGAPEALDAAARQVLGSSITEYADREAIEEALDPAASVASRDSLGGPAPEALRAALERAVDRLDDDRRKSTNRRESLDSAAESLRSEVTSYD